jgi:hypothetical protein
VGPRKRPLFPSNQNRIFAMSFRDLLDILAFKALVVILFVVLFSMPDTW